MASKKYKLNKEDGFKVWRGFVIFLAGTTIAYATEILPAIDWTIMVNDVPFNFTPIVGGLFGSLIELARRWLADYSQNG